MIKGSIFARFENSTSANATRIILPSDYSQYSADVLIVNNMFEMITFTDGMIYIVGYEIIQMLSNKFTHVGFFSESLIRSVFPIFLSPISDWSEYNIGSESLPSAKDFLETRVSLINYNI